MPYNLQLQQKQWIEKSKKIKKRDFYECNNCGNEFNLEVHHIEYIKNRYAWDYPNSHLIRLCKDCHEIEHNLYFGTKGRLKKYFLDIVYKTKLFPIWFNGVKLYEKDCDSFFLDIYKEINDKICYDKIQQGIYLNSGLFIQPNGQIIEED